jgi:FKBP-type peptidyl-prolyl cis-trans isomerase.
MNNNSSNKNNSTNTKINSNTKTNCGSKVNCGSNVNCSTRINYSVNSNNKLILLSLLLFTISISCVKQDRENTIIDQEKAIDTYISSLSDARVVRNNGSNRVVMEEGAGADTLAIGDSVYFYYSLYLFSSGSGKGTLYATNDTTVASSNNFIVSGEPQRLKIGSDAMVDGLENGLLGSKQGEKCYIIFSAKYGYYNTVVYGIPKLSPLFFDISISKIVKNK